MSEARKGAVLLVSPRYRRELTRMIEARQRAAVLPRDSGNPRAAFEGAKLSLVLIDARGAFGEAMHALRAIAPAAQRRPAALMVLLSRKDARLLGEVIEAGATHFLMSRVNADELAGLIELGERYAARAGEGPPRRPQPTVAPEHLWLPRWLWKRDDSVIAISPDLAQLVELPPETEQLHELNFPGVTPAAAERLERRVRRLIDARRSGTVRHMLAVGGAEHRLVHHVTLAHGTDGTVRAVAGTVEDLDAPPVSQPLPAQFDPTTRLANAEVARGWVQRQLARNDDVDPPVVVLLLSINRLDQINAAHGRDATDALLQAVARRLRREVKGAGRPPERALLARLGGAEFIVAFAGPVTLQDMIVFSQTLARAFERPFIVGHELIYLASRMGIAAADAETGSAETLFRRASAALSYAKTQDANSFRVFTSESGDVLTRMATLETDLRRALDEGELDILYQPQVEIVSNRIVGVEALTRWRHPALGTLSAETLLSVASNAEMTRRLSEHILRKALQECAAWPDALAFLRLSVNVTAEDIRGEGFGDMVLASLGESGFPARRLTLEVTESALLVDLEQAAQVMAALRAHGLRVAVDDFGTGYSALAYLKSLPLDCLKLDKKLVRDLGYGAARDNVLVRGVIDIARSLGLVVIAEGVETDAQLEILVRGGCNWYQGYLCAPPLALSALEPFVFDWNARFASAA